MDDHVNKDEQIRKRKEEEDDEELEEEKAAALGSGRSGKTFLPDPDEIGYSSTAPKPEGAEFKSMPTVSSLPVTAPFARPGGSSGVYLSAAAPEVPPPMQSNVWDKYKDPYTVEPNTPAADNSQPSPPDWYLAEIEVLPSYYPLEQSSKSFVIDHKNVTVNTITDSITRSLKFMSIQPKYIKDEASVALLTPENVEMYLCLWKTQDQRSIVVEIQRRRGCSIVFRKYCRHILDAAGGAFDGSEFSHKNDDVDFGSLKKAEKILLSEISTKSGATDEEESVAAIEIAHGLIKSADRIDAQILGMESLCIITNPRKTSIATSSVAGRAVLLGVGPEDNVEEQKIFKNSTFSDIRDLILTIILHRNLGDTGVMAAAEKMTIEYDSDDEDFFSDDAEFDGFPPTMKDTMNVMLNLALTVVANSLEVLMNADSGAVLEATSKAMSAESTDGIANRFLQEANEIAASKGFKRNNMLLTLITELGRAKTKTHNSCLAAKSLRHLCKASNDIFEEALKMNMKETGDKAYQVGRETHAGLETEIELFYKDHMH